MAYEAMNNAGARNERLIVILNDNDMSIAPPVGAMSAYLAAPRLRPHLSEAARCRQAAHPSLAQAHRPRHHPRGRACARLCHRRHAVRGARLLLCRPHRRAQSRPPAARAAQCARRRDRADPGACGHAEGQGLRAGGNLGRQISRRRQVRRRHRRAGEVAGQGAAIHQGIRASAGAGSAQGRSYRRHHRGDAVGHRARPVREGISPSASSTSASPSSTR